jgi:hypothetical protein
MLHIPVYQAIDIAPLSVAVKSCKIYTTPLTHVMDVDINILIDNTVFYIVLATIQKEADLVEAVRIAIIKAATA